MTNHTQYKTALEKELQELTTELERIATQNKETGDWIATPTGVAEGEADKNEVADTTEEWNERRALMAQLELRYHNVTHALERFANNTYGICEICNEPIETERLEANPASRTCKMHIEQERELPL